MTTTAEQIPLLGLMSEQVGQQREQILAEARAEAARIQGEAETQAHGTRSSVTGGVEGELRSPADRARERAEAEAHMILLTTKDTIADEILSRVEAELRTLAQGQDFPKIIESLLEELFADLDQHLGDKGVDKKSLVVLAPPAQLDLVRRWLDNHGHAQLKLQPLPSLRDGVAIQDEKRTFRTTNTLSVRFSKMEGELRKLSLERLFGENHTGATQVGGA